MEMMPMLVIMFLIFYFLLIRPQSKERKQQEAMRGALKKGDEVLTQGGILATVQSVKDTHVVIELEGNARMKVVKDAIIRLVNTKDGPAKKGDGAQKPDEKAAEAGS